MVAYIYDMRVETTGEVITVDQIQSDCNKTEGCDTNHGEGGRRQ